MSATASTPAATQTRPAELSVDWTRCDGHGLCAALLPEAIRVDDWGYPILDADRVAAIKTAKLRRVVGACPAMALRLA